VTVMNRQPILLPCMILYYSPGKKPFLAGPPEENKPTIREITDDEARILTLCQGEITLTDIAAKLNMDQTQVKSTSDKFSKEPDLFLQFIEDTEKHPSPTPHMEIAMEILSERDSAHEFIDNTGLLHEYHTGQITDAIEQFESHETTISHVYQQPHPALRGLSYGARLAEKFCEMEIMEKCTNILEIGGGTGFVARDFLGYLHQNQSIVFQNLYYVLLELSPVLLEGQKEYTRMYSNTIAQVLGDALAPPFIAGKFSLIIANEMIADLPSVFVKKEWMNRNTGHEIPAEAIPALKYINDFDVTVKDAFPEFLVNLGAWQLLEHIHLLLTPGGFALITEYGSPWRYPVAVHLPDHTEYAIHFGHLEEIAIRIGFDVRLEKMADFFDMDLDVTTLERMSLTILNQSLLSHLSQDPLPILAFTPEMLKQALGDLYPHIYNLRFSSLKQAGSQGSPSVFHALILRKKP